MSVDFGQLLLECGMLSPIVKDSSSTQILPPPPPPATSGLRLTLLLFTADSFLLSHEHTFETALSVTVIGSFIPFGD